VRKDHYFSPAKWTKELRRAIKLSRDHGLVYLFLESAPESHRTGLYFVTAASIAALTTVPEDDVRRIMGDLEKAGLLHWDEAADVVWLPAVCGEQYRWMGGTGAEKDNRTVEGRKHVAALPDSYVVRLFLDVWPVFREGASEGARHAPYREAPYPTTCPTPTPTPNNSSSQRKSEIPAADSRDSESVGNSERNGGRR
jgi:hypothetical protein